MNIAENIFQPILRHTSEINLSTIELINFTSMVRSPHNFNVCCNCL